MPKITCRYHITVYVKKDKNSSALTLSDDFALVNNTISIGENPSLQKINALQVFLSPYGVTVTKDGELQMSAHEDDYPVNLHLFIQALVSANDMFAPRYKQGSKANIFMALCQCHGQKEKPISMN